jgi:hypothetical protein
VLSFKKPSNPIKSLMLRQSQTSTKVGGGVEGDGR